MYIDLTSLPWTLVGWVPYTWAWLQAGGKDPTLPDPEFRRYQCTPEIPARVPGSVQDDLLRAGLLPDWNEGLNAPLCEWVEHRHWEYRTQLKVPAEWQGRRVLLRCEGLDYAGHILVDGQTVASFRGMLVPHEFDLTDVLRPGRRHRLSILFEEAPHEQGQLGYTSRSQYFKARHVYGWDWCPRLVPLGIWDRIALVSAGAVRLCGCLPYAHYDPVNRTGQLALRLAVQASSVGALACVVRVEDGNQVIHEQVLPCAFAPGRSETSLSIADRLAVEPWWPNGCGARKLYTVTVQLETISGLELDRWQGRVGFKRVRWLPCESSPANAEPWLCEVNGQPIFLQGVNWTPVRIPYGSVTREMYAQRLALYADMGVNLLRVWGGAVLEKEDFWALCDELGLLVWQEFPLSSSGADNLPPHDAVALKELSEIAASYIWRRGGHASHLLWCGGNELTARDGRNTPVDAADPTIAVLAGVAARLSPDKRFVPTSPSGPSFGYAPSQGGLGLHHDTHGPWNIEDTLERWRAHWRRHDALFVSEVGVPSCSSAEMLRRYAGGMALWPPSLDNPFWRYRSPWWVAWERMASTYSFEAARDELERFVSVSQEEQATALAEMVASCKRRFPRCGGVILWMGHDCYPCPANTSIVDYDGNPKPAVAALKAVFRGKQ